jgi:hypothetical protein
MKPDPHQVKGTPGKGIVKEWVCALGARMQGVLLAAVRGADGIDRDETSKILARMYRPLILYTHDENPSSFMMPVTYGPADPTGRFSAMDHHTLESLREHMKAFAKNHDHLPHHYILHFVHAAEIVGYKHPDPFVRDVWLGFYNRMCDKFHMNPETEAQLNDRLNADEETFRSRQ